MQILSQQRARLILRLQSTPIRQGQHRDYASWSPSQQAARHRGIESATEVVSCPRSGSSLDRLCAETQKTVASDLELLCKARVAWGRVMALVSYMTALGKGQPRLRWRSHVEDGCT